jgi:DNA-binding NarL/FixJ family response regulator
MSFFRRFLEALLPKEPGAEQPRVFLQDEELITAIKDVARRQQRTEEDVVTEFTKVGLNQFWTQNELKERWSSLSRREQQVVALLCLGYKHNEIAKILVIAPETVKKHLQSIFNKFNLRSSKELRLVLKNWDFQEWWDHNQQD